MMAAGGYPWTVIPVGAQIYMDALEKASVGEDIAPFADFLSGLVEKVSRASRCQQYRRRNHERCNMATNLWPFCFMIC